MFKYNELSDLITGELVTPIKKAGNDVLCINREGKQVVHSINDFDFDKTIEERVFVVEDDSSDDSSEDSSDVPSEEISNQSELNERHWIVDDYFKYSLAKKIGIKPNEYKKLLIWEE
jgi:hypothetical protein